MKSWEDVPQAARSAIVLVSIATVAFGAGLNARVLLELPDIAEDNRAAIREHVQLPAHPEILDASYRADSLLVEMIHRGNDRIVAHLERLVCIERLDRRSPETPPSAVDRECPPPPPNERDALPRPRNDGPPEDR